MKKTCNTCNTKKNIDDFYLSRSKPCNPCRKCCISKAHIRYKKNQTKLQEYGKIHYSLNRDLYKQRTSEWKQKNPERTKILNNKSYIKNKKKQNEKNRIRQKERRKTDIGFRILMNLRRRLNRAIKGEDKSSTTQKLLGCSIENLSFFLESKFKPGMSWENYGYGNDKWHIDHVIPCSYFNMSNPDEQSKCFNYNNLQPLWQKENLSKKNKLCITNTCI